MDRIKIDKEALKREIRESIHSGKTLNLGDNLRALKRTGKYPVISACPVCHGDLHVTKLVCDSCGTALEGQFTLSKFNYLATEQLYFIEVFVKNRGNIKAVEKEMDLSYPTIKKMLDDVIVGLGYVPDSGSPAEEAAGNSPVSPEKPDSPEDPKMTRLEIISKLQNGEITVAQATELLKKVKK
jgi:hypothetical protein